MAAIIRYAAKDPTNQVLLDDVQVAALAQQILGLMQMTGGARGRRTSSQLRQASSTTPSSADAEHGPAAGSVVAARRRRRRRAGGRARHPARRHQGQPGDGDAARGASIASTRSAPIERTPGQEDRRCTSARIWDTEHVNQNTTQQRPERPARAPGSTGADRTRDRHGTQDPRHRSRHLLGEAGGAVEPASASRSSPGSRARAARARSKARRSCERAARTRRPRSSPTRSCRPRCSRPRSAATATLRLCRPAVLRSEEDRAGARLRAGVADPRRARRAGLRQRRLDDAPGRGGDHDDQRHRRRRAARDGARARRRRWRRSAPSRASSAPPRSAYAACAATPSPPATAPTQARASTSATATPTSCVVRGGTVLFARSIPRGGEDVTVRHRRAFRMIAGGRRAAPSTSRRSSPRRGAPSPRRRTQRVDAVVREALRPLMRELQADAGRLSRRRRDAGPSACSSPAAAARLQGFVEHVEVELGVVAARLALTRRRSLPRAGDGRARARRRRPCRRWRCRRRRSGWRSPRRRRCRRSTCARADLAYRTDYSYLRGKAGYLAAAVLAVLAFAGHQRRRVAARAAQGGRGARGAAASKQTHRALRRADGRRQGGVGGAARRAPRAAAPPVPTMTAYDLLDEISHHVPPAATRGNSTSPSSKSSRRRRTSRAPPRPRPQVDELAQRADQDRLLRDARDRQDLDGDGAAVGRERRRGDKPRELKQFDLTITNTCP